MVIGLAVAFVIHVANSEPPPSDPVKTINVDNFDPPCGGIGDCDGDGVPESVEADLRREQRSQLAQDYCGGIGSDYEGEAEACVEDVVDGRVEVDPVDVSSAPTTPHVPAGRYMCRERGSNPHGPKPTGF